MRGAAATAFGPAPLCGMTTRVQCYRHRVLEDLGLDWSVIKKEPTNGILSVVAADVRQCGLGVAADPNPDYIPPEQLQPADSAHALIVVEDDVKPRKRGERCSRLARTARIVHWGGDVDLNWPQGDVTATPKWLEAD